MAGMVTAEALALQLELDAQLDQVTDAQVRALVATWALAWAEVSTDLQDTLETLLADGERVSRAAMMRSRRLQVVLRQIGQRLEDLAEQAGVTITSDLDAVVRRAADAQDDLVLALLPDDPGARALVNARGTAVSAHALDAIVRRATEQITALTRPVSAETELAIRRELIRGVAVGSNPRETARRMVQRTEGRFNGGLARALTIARTETLDAHRAAAEAGQAQHAEVLTGWLWLCHLSPRTCPACLARHGTFHPLEESGPHDHQAGRCSRMPQVKPWAELGFDVDEPPSAVPDAQAWFQALPEADQIAIMGARRLELLRTGAIAWADLATLRRTPGWRDSWAVTPVTALAQRRGRAAS